MSETITAQELFSDVVTKVVAQGRPSEDDKGNCLYRHPEGLKCAAGHALTDEEFEYAGGRALNGAWLGALTLPDRLKPHVDLLDNLQVCHDAANRDNFVPAFLSMAADAALTFNLTMPVLP